LLDSPLEPHHEQKQEGSYGHGEQSKIPVEPEHQAEHTDDRKKVDENAQRPGGGKRLDCPDVGCYCAQKRADLMAVVVLEREALQMMIRSHAEIVRNPLAHTLGVITIDVGRCRADGGDSYSGNGCRCSNMHFAGAAHDIPYPVSKPARKMMAP